MKSFLKIVFSFFVLSLVMSAFAFADASAIPDPSSLPWVGSVIQVLSGLPYIGPVLLKVISYSGAVAGVMTAVAVCAQAVLTALAGILNVGGLSTKANAVLAFEAKIVPWLQYLSIFNVQKSAPKV
jgi:hypothetical protein